MKLKIRGILEAASITIALMIAGMAQAGTIGINGSVLTAFTDNTDDVLLLVEDNSNLVFFGIDTFLAVTPGCNIDLGSGAAFCILAGLSEVRINMQGGDDTVLLDGLIALPDILFTVLGGEGNDILVGGINGEWMYGGDDDDILLGGAGMNCLSGGAGDNIVLDSTCDPGAEPEFGPAQPTAVSEPISSLLFFTSLAVLGAIFRLRARFQPDASAVTRLA